MHITLIAIFLVLTLSVSQAQEVSAEARTLHQQLTFQVAFSVKNWVQLEVRKVRGNPLWDENRVRADAFAQFAGRPLPVSDVDALVFLVFMDVIQTYDQDIRLLRSRAASTGATKTATNAPPQQLAPEKALQEHRAILAVRVGELGRKLLGLQGSLLKSIR
jgi:hypothetical protein